MLKIYKKRNEKIQFDVEIDGKTETFLMDTTVIPIQGKEYVHFVFDAPRNVKITRVEKEFKKNTKK